jgi:hypothetical protein
MIGLHEDGQGDYSHTQFFLVFLQIPKQKWVIANIKLKVKEVERMTCTKYHLDIYIIHIIIIYKP